MTERRSLLADIVVSTIDRGGTIRVRNVLNPLLWLCAVSAPACLFFAWLIGSGTIIGVVLTTVAVLPILVAMAMYVWFALHDPDRLQSEEFVLRQQEIELRQKGGFIIGSAAESTIDPLDEIADGTSKELPR